MNDEQFRAEALTALQAIAAAIGALGEQIERLCPPPSAKPPSSKRGRKS